MLESSSNSGGHHSLQLLCKLSAQVPTVISLSQLHFHSSAPAKPPLESCANERGCGCMYACPPAPTCPPAGACRKPRGKFPAQRTVCPEGELLCKLLKNKCPFHKVPAKNVSRCVYTCSQLGWITIEYHFVTQIMNSEHNSSVNCHSCLVRESLIFSLIWKKPQHYLWATAP